MAAWMATSNIWRGISFRNRSISSFATLVGNIRDERLSTAHPPIRPRPDVQLHHGRNPITGQMVIKRRISARGGFQAVVEIQNDLVQRQFVQEQTRPPPKILEFLLIAALLLEQFQNLTDVFFARDHSRVDDRFLDLLRLGRIGEFRRTLDHDHFVVRQSDTVPHTGRGGDQIDVELPLEPLLNDFHMQESEKAATKAEAERDRVFGLEVEGAIV